jgi:hypothetical protein
MTNTTAGFGTVDWLLRTIGVQAQFYRGKTVLGDTEFSRGRKFNP